MDPQQLSDTVGTVFNIQKFCTDDGPGIRTTVFLKGCHLQCAWCHNPEGLSLHPILEFSQPDCVSCRRCEAVCPNGVHSFRDGRHSIDRSRCTGCGACVEGCSYSALSFCGKAMTAGQILEIALADKPFYFPEGGITLSGGEPLLQPDFVLALGTLAKAQGISVCVETSGAVPFSVFEKILPAVDLFLFDIKETNPDRHLRFTKVRNALPLENIKKLDSLGAPVFMRCPIIPGVNDRESHFDALAKLYSSLSHAKGIQLMPYHRLGQGKTTLFGSQSQDFRVPDNDEIARWNRTLQNAICRYSPERRQTMKNTTELLENPLSFSSHGRFLLKHGMYSAALYYKNRNETPDRRAARAARYALENSALPVYTPGQVVGLSCGNTIYRFAPQDDVMGWGLHFHADGFCGFDADTFRKLHEKCENSVEHYIVDSIIADCRAMYSDISGSRYNHGGTHNVPDIEFVLHHGISAYRERIEEARDASTDSGTRMFQEGLLDVLEGTETFVHRYIAYLESLDSEHDLARLVDALKQVPLKPARNFFEAFISANMTMGLAGNFEPGRIDNYLWPYYEKDLAEGKTSPEEAFRLIRAMFVDINEAIGHPGVTHVTIGGTYPDGSPCYNALTEIAIRAIAGLRTPNVTLRVRRDMPEDIWNAALENIKKGGSHPALVNEELFLEKLTTDYAVPYHDAVNYVFGGCSELLIQGKTMCDSTWVQYNMLDIFENTLYNHFLICDSFDAFYEKVKADIFTTLDELELHINNRQLAEGIHRPALMKTLLADGCIQHGKSFSAGGATYNFDSTNIYAGTNTVNSLYTLKQYYDGKLGDFPREEFLSALIDNFEGHGELFAKCKKVTKFGNYDPELNALARDLMTFTFKKVMQLRCWRKNSTYEGRFMPAIILWVDWISSGQRVGATPDGRLLGEATVDSCGPMQGTDTEGPTSVMGAALALDQGNCAGTCVLNLRLDQANFRTPEATKKVRQLLEVYFRQGGSQVQINVVDPKILREAYEDPTKHRDIIVRVGGFSDNFVMLDKTIQQEILKRTEHNI